MRSSYPTLLLSLLVAMLAPVGPAGAQAPATTQAAVKQGGFPGMAIDVEKRQIRLDCETLDIVTPLEFFCVVSGTNEHESLLRSPVKPSHVHAALLMLGIEPGRPVKYSEATNKWIAPSGPPLQLFVEFEKDGRLQRYPAYRLMRDVTTKKEMPAMTWLFVGSRILDDGGYAADATGYLVSVVNFELTVIDVPNLASSANETLSWEINHDLMPPLGTKATLIIEPVGTGAAPVTTRPAETGLSQVTTDTGLMDRLQAAWEKSVKPHDAALREAAQAHYDAITAMRHEQQRLIDEADRIQRKIDELEKSYQDMTTPRPAPVSP